MNKFLDKIMKVKMANELICFTVIRKVFILLAISFSILYSETKDPINAQIHTLENGIKVYFSVNKVEPKIVSAIAVRSGSKHNPDDTTGLAHYFEHLMFKGSDKIGTQNYVEEKKYLDKIEELFEVYRKSSDNEKRKQIYMEIDKLSQKAAEFVSNNEYDQLIASIGASETNAYTSNDETVYLNTIPSNRLKDFLDVEYERFENPVLRLFHTELETVYEEKNRALDNEQRQTFMFLLAKLFKNHQYGVDGLGKVEHLLNPSILNVRKFYEKHYIPKNMAIILAGDFEPEIALAEINATFGKMKNPPDYEKNLEFEVRKEEKIREPEIYKISGKTNEQVYIAYRLPTTVKNSDFLILIDMILSNSKAGILDTNINQKQLALGVFSSAMYFNDYSVLLLGGMPTKGQNLIDLRNLLLMQIEKLKDGDFPDWLPEAIINNIKLSELRSQENNQFRMKMMLDSFISGEKWENVISTLNRLEKIGKDEIVKFARKNFNNNYIAIEKSFGEVKEPEKIEKPKITPITKTSSEKSVYFTEFIKREVKGIEPEFIDIEKSLHKEYIAINNEPGTIYYKENKNNELFSLRLTFPIGELNNKKLSLAVEYLELLGTKDFTHSEFLQQLYKIGCEFNISVAEKSTSLSFFGLAKYQKEVLNLVSQLFYSPIIYDENTLDLLKSRILQSMENNRKNPEYIFENALIQYSKYQKNSPYNYRLNTQEIKKITSSELLRALPKIYDTTPTITYFGPKNYETVVLEIEKFLGQKISDKIEYDIDPEKTTFYSQNLHKTATKRFKEKMLPQIYFLNYPDMKQAQIMIFTHSTKYNAENKAIRRIFNEYFGIGLSSILFQEVREKRALAYSVYSYFNAPNERYKKNQVITFVGTQADKTTKAIDTILELLNKVPLREKQFEISKIAAESKIRLERFTPVKLLEFAKSLDEMGETTDLRKEIYESIKTKTLNDLAEFCAENIQNRENTIVIMGDKKSLNLQELEKYKLKITELTLAEIMHEN